VVLRHSGPTDFHSQFGGFEKEIPGEIKNPTQSAWG